MGRRRLHRRGRKKRNQVRMTGISVQGDNVPIDVVARLVGSAIGSFFGTVLSNLAVPKPDCICETCKIERARNITPTPAKELQP